MKARTRLSVIAVGLLGSTALAPVALAAAPSNDLFTGAEAVTIGFSDSVDTTDATTDADDVQLNDQCGAPATDASVWYSIEGTDAFVIIDVSGSDYFAGIAIGTGTQGDLAIVDCGPDTVGFFGESGTTYYVLAFDDQEDGGGNGGTLNISFVEAPPPPTVDLRIRDTGRFSSTGGFAVVRGRFTCTDADFIDIAVEVRQRVGRVVISGVGSFFAEGMCDGESHRFRARVFGDNGRFGGGKARAFASGFACGALDCGFGEADRVIQLKGKL